MHLLTPEELHDAGTQFFLALYGSTNNMLLAEARHLLFCKRKTPQTFNQLPLKFANL